jgi:hypothetical protein
MVRALAKALLRVVFAEVVDIPGMWQLVAFAILKGECS